MPDPLLIVVGFFVTVIVGLAVWSVERLDVDDNADRDSGRTGPRDGDRR